MNFQNRINRPGTADALEFQSILRMAARRSNSVVLSVDEDGPFSIAYESMRDDVDGYSSKRPDPLRDLRSLRTSRFFSTSGRRLLQGAPPHNSSKSDMGMLSVGVIIGIAVGASVVAITAILALVIFYIRKRKIRSRAKFSQPKREPKDASISNGISDSGQLLCQPAAGFGDLGFWMKSLPIQSRYKAAIKPKVYLSSACEMDFPELQASTDNFSDASLLGEGGSARVYRAKLSNDDFGAVKVMQGEGRHALKEFQAEVDLMRQVRHPNLVSLLGYCIQGNRHFLIYELMQNGSLEEQLYGPKEGTGLSWFARIKIALDSARGLEYLHEHCVPPLVHRDFKASNILLDANLNAKISDFGLATPLEGLTREVSLQLVGTIGYVAPEFFESGTLTKKSDVYAFGVTLLELLTGRKPVDHSLPCNQQSLVKWATPQLTDRARLPKIVAPNLKENLNLKHLYQVAAVAALCVQKEPTYRPLIADVVQSLVPLVPLELGGAFKSEISNQSNTKPPIQQNQSPLSQRNRSPPSQQNRSPPIQRNHSPPGIQQNQQNLQSESFTVEIPSDFPTDSSVETNV